MTLRGGGGGGGRVSVIMTLIFLQIVWMWPLSFVVKIFTEASASVASMVVTALTLRCLSSILDTELQNLCN